MNQKETTKILTLEDVITHKGESWRATLRLARELVPHTYLSDRNLVRLTKGAATPEQTEVLVKLLSFDFLERPIGQNGIDLFFRIVDHSNYSLGSWLKSIVFFQTWLEDHNRSASFLKMLGFIQCCEDSPENKEGDYVLMDLVKDMLTENGYVD